MGDSAEAESTSRDERVRDADRPPPYRVCPCHDSSIINALSLPKIIILIVSFDLFSTAPQCCCTILVYVMV